MNDKIVINTISKIYFIIVSFISFILLTLSLIFIILQNGLTVQEIDLPSVKIKQLYIKWNEKINISVKDVQIIKSSKKSTGVNYQKINKLFTQLSLFDNWIETINIKRMVFNDFNASLNFNHLAGGDFQLHSQNISLASTISVEPSSLNININKFEDAKRNISISGNVILDKQMDLVLDLDTQINTISLHLIASANKENILYKISSDQKIKSISDIVYSFNLPKELHYWLVDAIDMSHATINKLYGWIDYDDISNSYKNIYADVSLEKLNYTYDRKLDAIHTAYTQIEFKDGVLFINPKEAYSYQQYLGSSKLNIDFTGKNEILTLYLAFDGILNEGMHTILKRYKINVPFFQNSGTIKTNLKLAVNLMTLDVDAHGDFFTKEANFDYFALNIDVFDTYMTLDNFDIKITQMFAKYKDIASSKVSAYFNAKKSSGKINFDIQSLELPNYNLSLKNKSLKAIYSINPKKDTIKIAQSDWKFYNETLKLQKLNLDFNLKTLNLFIPQTRLEVEDIAQMNLSGLVNLKNITSDLNINLLNIDYNGVKLNQTTKLNLFYDTNITITLKDKALFTFKEEEFHLQNSSIVSQDSNISLTTDFDFGTSTHTYLTLDYNLDQNRGNFRLRDTTLLQDNTLLFFKKEPINFQISYLKNELSIDSEEIDLNFLFNEDVWILNTNSLAKLSPYSEVLQKFKLKDGRINLYQKTNSSDINYNASIFYPHKIMVVENTPVDNYEIYGHMDTKTKAIELDINNLIDVKIEDNITINMKNIGIDIDQLLHALDTNTSNEDSAKKDIYLFAKDCFLYVSKDRRVISDTIKLSYKEDVLSADLIYADAEANLKYTQDAFHLYGDNFNDKFMEELFSLSKFKGGRLDFAMNGTPDQYDGIFHINNSTIKSYKVLNNILAFINTIPSLVTFSLPGYDKDGLKIKNAYMKFTSKNDVFDISDIYLNSKEIDIVGRGTTSYKENTIDLDLNLKTDLASTVSQIPVVGYILFDEDSVSTSIEVKGKLTDPKVESRLAQEIVVAPLNIIKRTLLYPYYLLSGEDIQDENISQKK